MIVSESNKLLDNIANKLNLIIRAMEKEKTAEEIIVDLDLDENSFPHLSRWKDKEHLLATLQGIAKASKCELKTAAVNLEIDLSMM